MSSPTVSGRQETLAPAPAARPLKTITHTRPKALVLSAGGGFLLLCLGRAYLFRWSHPDWLYVGFACFLMFVMGLAMWFPPRLVLSAREIWGTNYGRTWIKVPWQAVAAIEMFETPVSSAAASSVERSPRVLGFRVKPEYKGKIQPKTGRYGYDATVASIWDVSIDTLADQCLDFWRAQGGSGELISHIGMFARPLEPSA